MQNPHSRIVDRYAEIDRCEMRLNYIKYMASQSSVFVNAITKESCKTEKAKYFRVLLRDYLPLADNDPQLLKHVDEQEKEDESSVENDDEEKEKEEDDEKKVVKKKRNEDQNKSTVFLPLLRKICDQWEEKCNSLPQLA